MFGYIKPNVPLLRVCEYDRYKAIYCGICHALGKRIGPSARLRLSYDLVFFALLYAAVNRRENTTEKRACMLNPIKKRPVLTDEATIEYACDCAILLQYYKLLDARRDREGAAGSLRVYRREIEAIRARREAMVGEAQQAIAPQEALEAQACADIDLAANPTGELIGALCAAAAQDGDMQARLRDFGYLVGRWVYLVDAADDRIADAKKNDYNPFLLSGMQAGDIAAVMHLTLDELADRFDDLELGARAAILHNIVNQGLPCEQARAIEHPKKEGKHGETERQGA